jgi:hypothetical protein
MTICELSITLESSRKCDGLNISQTYGPATDSFMKPLDSGLSSEAGYPHWGFSKSTPPPPQKSFKAHDEQHWKISLNHILLSHHSGRPIKWWSTPMQLLNSPIINNHYLIIHTISGATAHSSRVARRVASLLLPNSVLICMQWSRPHGAAVHLTAISSPQSLLDWQQTVTIT